MAGELWQRIQASLADEQAEWREQLRQEDEQRRASFERNQQQINEASELLVPYFREFEEHGQDIQASTIHGITQHPRHAYPQFRFQPVQYLIGNTVSLYWGDKLELSESDKDLIERWQVAQRLTRRFRSGFPDAITEYAHNLVSADVSEKGVRFGFGGKEPLSLERFLKQPDIIIPSMARAIANPTWYTHLRLRHFDYKK